jgi:hypothetical protein
MRRIALVLPSIAVLALTGCSQPISEPVESTFTATEARPSPTSTPRATSTPVEAAEATSDDFSDIYPVKPAATTLTCEEAMAAAANVPGAMVNNNEIYVSLLACASVDEWGSALVSYPMAFGMTRVAAGEIMDYADIACYGASETPVCMDAATRR